MAIFLSLELPTRFSNNGGEGGIRTLEARYIGPAPLAGVCIRPLCHFSASLF